eukprot:scaffold7444_cov90-Skeletonema_dohrnii-CCMP3373.AAC.3
MMQSILPFIVLTLMLSRGSATDSRAITECTELTTQTDCAALHGCIWSTEAHVCLGYPEPNPNPIHCYNIRTESECDAAGCDWMPSEGMCGAGEGARWHPEHLTARKASPTDASISSEADYGYEGKRAEVDDITPKDDLSTEYEYDEEDLPNHDVYISAGITSGKPSRNGKGFLRLRAGERDGNSNSNGVDSSLLAVAVDE